MTGLESTLVQWARVGMNLPTDSRDSYYLTNANDFTNYEDAFNFTRNGGTNFNLNQWFTDQGITDPQARTYYNYARLRGIENRPDVVQYGQELWGSGINPYTFIPSGPSKSRNPQNSAGLGVAPNGGQYNDKTIRTLLNRDNRALLQGSGGIESQTSSQNIPTILGAKLGMSAQQLAAMKSPSPGGIAWSEIDPRDDAYRNMKGAEGAIGLTDFTLSQNPNAPGFLPYQVVDGKKVYTNVRPASTPIASSIQNKAAPMITAGGINDPSAASMNMIMQAMGVTNPSSAAKSRAEAFKVTPITATAAQTSTPSQSLASYMLNNKGQGFNLQQWFLDQGMTNTDQMSYANYATVRGLDPYRRATFSPNLQTVNYGGTLDSFDTPKQAPAPNMNLAPLNSANTPLNLPNVNYRYNTPGTAPQKQLPNSGRTRLRSSGGAQGVDEFGSDVDLSPTGNNKLALAVPTILGVRT